MQALVERHLKAEALAMSRAPSRCNTDDIEHDVVASPTGPLHGREAARQFYR
jgi:hypothetical protein